MPSTAGIVASHFTARPTMFKTPQNSVGEFQSTYFTTPDSATNDLTGDLTIIMNTPYYTTTTDWYAGKWTASQSWGFFKTASTTLRFTWRGGGTTRAVNFSTTSLINGTIYWWKVELDVNNGSGGHGVSLFTAPDQEDRPDPTSSVWTQVGSTLNAGAFTTSVDTSTALISVGSDGSPVQNANHGGILRRFTLYSGIGGSATPVVDLNPADATAPQSTTITSSATGEVWTVQNPNGAVTVNLNPSAVVLCEGDSLTYGTKAGSAANSYPSQMVALLDGDPAVLNSGDPGGTTQQMVDHVGRDVTPMLRRDCVSVLVVRIGTNDLFTGAYGTLGDALVDLIKSYCSARRAEGWRVVLCTIIPHVSSTGGTETRRVNINTRIRAEWTECADALADLDGDVRLQNVADTTYYDVDQIHHNATGYGVCADLIAAQVNTLI